MLNHLNVAEILDQCASYPHTSTNVMSIHLLSLKRASFRVPGTGKLLRQRGAKFHVAITTAPLPVSCGTPFFGLVTTAALVDARGTGRGQGMSHAGRRNGV